MRGLFREIDVNPYKGERSEPGGTAIIATHGRIYLLVSMGMEIERCTRPYAAFGSGMEIALGSLYATQEQGLGVAKRAGLALEAAAALRNDVAGPFRYAMVSGDQSCSI